MDKSSKSTEKREINFLSDDQRDFRNSSNKNENNKKYDSSKIEGGSGGSTSNKQSSENKNKDILNKIRANCHPKLTMLGQASILLQGTGPRSGSIPTATLERSRYHTTQLGLCYHRHFLAAMSL
ncbi:hypothetical protein SLA2020_499650 [Shorea laevis]